MAGPGLETVPMFLVARRPGPVLVLRSAERVFIAAVLSVAIAGCDDAARSRPTPDPVGTVRDAGPVALVPGPDVRGIEGHGGIAVVPSGQSGNPLADAINRAMRDGGAVSRRPTEDPNEFMKADELRPDAGEWTEEQAMERYLRGYWLKDGDPGKAEALFREVIAHTTEGSPVRAKAARQLEALGVRPSAE